MKQNHVSEEDSDSLYQGHTYIGVATDHVIESVSQPALGSGNGVSPYVKIVNAHHSASFPKIKK